MTADGLLDDHKTIGWRLLQRRRDQLSAGHHLCEPHGIRHSVRASSFLMPGAVRVFALADADKPREWFVAADAR